MCIKGRYEETRKAARRVEGKVCKLYIRRENWCPEHTKNSCKSVTKPPTAPLKHGPRTGADIALRRTRDWPRTRCAPALTTRETQTSPSEATSPVGAAAVHTPEHTHCPRGRGEAGTLRTATGMDNGAAAAETRTGVLKN